MRRAGGPRRTTTRLPIVRPRTPTRTRRARPVLAAAENSVPATPFDGGRAATGCTTPARPTNGVQQTRPRRSLTTPVVTVGRRPCPASGEVPGCDAMSSVASRRRSQCPDTADLGDGDETDLADVPHAG